MKQKQTENFSFITVLQVVINILAAVGFLIALLTSNEVSSKIIFGMVLPLVILDLILCFYNQKKTLEYDVVNIMMAALSIVPYVGFIMKAAGVILSLFATVKTFSKA